MTAPKQALKSLTFAALPKREANPVQERRPCRRQAAFGGWTVDIIANRRSEMGRSEYQVLTRRPQVVRFVFLDEVGILLQSPAAT